MWIAYVVVSVAAAAVNGWAAYVDFVRAEWVLANMKSYGIPESRLFLLGALKGAGAAGLLIGIAAPPVGVAAALGLVAYFVGAIVTVLRAGYGSHVRYPAPFLLLAIASLGLRLSANG